MQAVRRRTQIDGKNLSTQLSLGRRNHEDFIETGQRSNHNHHRGSSAPDINEHRIHESTTTARIKSAILCRPGSGSRTAQQGHLISRNQMRHNDGDQQLDRIPPWIRTAMRTQRRGKRRQSSNKLSAGGGMPTPQQIMVMFRHSPSSRVLTGQTEEKTDP